MKKILYKTPTGFSTLLIFIIAAVVVVAILATFFILKSPQGGPIKIGAVLSLAGPGESYGRSVKEGMVLAVDEINSWGGINGRQIELIIEDCETNPENAKEAFKKIEAAHQPLFYVSMMSSISFALAPLAEKNEVVLLGTLVTSHKFTTQKQWVFKYFSSAKTDVPATLLTLQKLRPTFLGVLYLNDEYGTSVFELLKQGFEEIGGTIEGESYGVKGAEIKDKIKNLSNAEAIYIVGFGPHIKAALRELRETRFQGFILGGNASNDPEITSMPEANGMYITAPIVYNPNYLYAKELKEKYEAAYNKPLAQWSANGYDSLKLLASLLEGKRVSRESLKGLLEGGFIYSGVFGSLDIKPGEHDIVYKLLPAQITEGKIRYFH